MRPSGCFAGPPPGQTASTSDGLGRSCGRASQEPGKNGEHERASFLVMVVVSPVRFTAKFALYRGGPVFRREWPPGEWFSRKKGLTMNRVHRHCFLAGRGATIK